MKKQYLFGAIGAVLLSAVTYPLDAIEVLTEAKAGYFYPTSSRFRNIYSGTGIYGLEFSCQAWKNIYAWASGSYFHQTGRSIGDNSRTNITLCPIDYGLKYIFDINKYLDFYLGFGGTATYVNMHDKSPYVIQSISKWGWGGVAKTGFLVNITNDFFLNFFADYSFVKVNFDNTCDGEVVRNNADVSGVSAGGAIGFRF